MKTSKLSILIVLVIAICTGTVTELQAKKLHRTKVKNMKQLQEYFTYKEGRPVIISAHRGGMLTGYPENSIESCEKTLSLMESFFEIDPRMTKDSVMVLMHDATIDRTTNGKGKVSDYTYMELQQFNLKDRDGNITSYKIPTLQEMLDWGKKKTIFNFDNKNIPWSIYSKMLNDQKIANVMLSVRSLKEALYYFERNDNVVLCVPIFSMDDYNAYKNSGIPWNRMMAYVGLSMKPEQQEVYNLLHSHGVMYMTSIHPTADRVKPDEARLDAYRKELASRPDIIETDYPALFKDLQR